MKKEVKEESPLKNFAPFIIFGFIVIGVFVVFVIIKNAIPQQTGGDTYTDPVSGEVIDTLEGAVDSTEAIKGFNLLENEFPISVYETLSQNLRYYLKTAFSGESFSYKKDSLSQDGTSGEFKLVSSSRTLVISYELANEKLAAYSIADNGKQIYEFKN